MKQLVLLLISISILTACNNKNKSAGSAAGSSDSTGNNTEAVSSVQKKVEALEQLTPYTLEQMKALIPPALFSTDSSMVSAFTNMGAGFAQAHYRHDDYMSIDLNIFDCGGSAGAGLYSRHYQEVENMKDANAKVIDFKGEKAIEHLTDGDSNQPVFTFIANGRLLVTLEGEKFDMETLKDIARELSLKP